MVSAKKRGNRAGQVGFFSASGGSVSAVAPFASVFSFLVEVPSMSSHQPGRIVLALVALTLGTTAAFAATHKSLPANLKAAFRAKMPAVKETAAEKKATVDSHRSTFTLFFDEFVHLDQDGDGEITFGDQIIGNGGFVDSFGREIGTWEGTITNSSKPTFSFNFTMRFVNQGTVVVNGAAYPDGVRSRAFAAPIVGGTGRYSGGGQAGLAFDDDGNLVVKLGVR
jgi:hypothetical protein